jgi:ribosomal protein S28E/S33
MSLSIDEGDRMTWRANAYGGNGSYHFSWDGTDGLSGTGQSVSKRYNNEGYKNATVTVRSGNQTISRNCDGSVRVDDNDNYNYNYDYQYYGNNYNYPLSVSCSANVNSAAVGNSVRWNAYASGGNGSYRYSWNGTDGISGSSQSAYRSYNNPGIKYASVTVWSDGQSVTQSCSGSVNVGGYYYNTGVTNNAGLDIACYSDPRTVTVNQPATWITEVTGGVAPYTYTWSGTDDLSGSGSSVIKYYGTTGNKTAVINVKSADGRSESRACSTSITVRSTSTGGGTVAPTNVDNDEDSDNGLSAAALFSLKNVPWGWVAILVILVLFGTIVYLIYNRPKI